ncbi:MAG: hypothetical protein JWM35_184, partial [Verrucomicrobia bacterium]|nr:hypothetical protein [Verrucomicrobiota bacterium]
RVRAMPLLATVAWMLSLVCAVLAAAMGERGLGTLTFFSVGVFLGWIGFAGFAFAGVVLALKYRREGVRLVWWHSFLVSVVLSVDAVYLIRMGIIGWRPWA